MVILGITGTDGSGKGTVVEYLVTRYGFTHYSARSIFIEELSVRGIEPTRANMRLIANEMRATYGDDFVVTRNLARIGDTEKNVVIESIRTTAEAETLKQNGGILLAVDADQHIRYARVQSRRSETDKVTFEEFVRHEALEANDPDPHGMQKARVMQMADYTIYNDGSVEALYVDIDRVFTHICSQN